MREQPKARPPGNNQYVDRGTPNPEAPPTLASQGIDKNLAKRARVWARSGTLTIRDPHCCVPFPRCALARGIEWYLSTLLRSPHAHLTLMLELGAANSGPEVPPCPTMLML
jgi:hypothetical protein